MSEEAQIERANEIASALEGIGQQISIYLGELTLSLDSSKDLLAVLRKLRDSNILSYDQLVDATAVDWLSRQPRFDVVYHLLSYKHNARLRLVVPASEDEPLPTVSQLYSSALWYEREIWDMYGLFFDQHPDMRRILTDYGFEGHPLRKDFPLTGYVEVRYDETEQRVVYEPVQLPQEYRNFDYSSPWEAVTDRLTPVLPGDEKA